MALEIVAASAGSEMVEFSFRTTAGIVDFLAELSLDGDTVVFTDVCIYPRESSNIRPGQILAEVPRQKRLLVETIHRLGWHAVRMSGPRADNSSSAHIGKNVRLATKVAK